MNPNDYRLNAYKKASQSDSTEIDNENNTRSISKQIRHNSPAGTETLIRKPAFEHINSKLNALDKQNELLKKSKNISDKKNKTDNDLLLDQQAQIAAQSGTWFAKKHSTTPEDVKNAAAALTSGGLIKVPNQPKNGEKESIYRRVAKFLVLIGVDEASKILPHLTEEQTEKIIPEIASIQKIDSTEAEQIIQEFKGLLEKSRESGGIDTARLILTKAYGEKKAQDFIDKAAKYVKNRPFEYLDDADPERIRVLLNGENPSVQALVLSQLESRKSAAIINAMETELKKEVILRLAKMNKVSPEVIANLDKSLHEKMLTQNTENSQNMDGRSVLAQILKKMDPVTEASLIDNISDEDPDLGSDLRKRLFTEEDVVGADDRYIQKVLQDMSLDDIAILIRRKSIAFRSKILSNMSSNRKSDVLDEEASKEHILKSDSEMITSKFYSILRNAWEKGELRINGRDDDEVYV